MNKESGSETAAKTESRKGSNALKVFVAIIIILLTAAMVTLLSNILEKQENPAVVAENALRLIVAGNREELAKITSPGREAQLQEIKGFKDIKQEALAKPNPELTIKAGNTYKTVYFLNGEKGQYQIGIILVKAKKKWKLNQIIIDAKPEDNTLKP
ncbi:MAG: hypothetical protein LWY06_20850 [Firmicutes bacterium]|nr:hypothetical protein [Bacillota bacterium]